MITVNSGRFFKKQKEINIPTQYGTELNLKMAVINKIDTLQIILKVGLNFNYLINVCIHHSLNAYYKIRKSGKCNFFPYSSSSSPVIDDIYFVGQNRFHFIN